jgi:2OG-Fe(II) oxygenase superfamily
MRLAGVILLPTMATSSPRMLATIRTYSGIDRKWGPTNVVAWADGRSDIEIPLPKGGMIRIFPDFVPDEEAKKITEDVLANPEFFRHYTVQGVNDEPRVSAHFHAHATPNFDDFQPGYRYNGSTTLKARPLSAMSSLEELANRTQSFCAVNNWNIGVTVVIYRDGNDKMGQHTGRFHDLFGILLVIHMVNSVRRLPCHR